MTITTMEDAVREAVKQTKSRIPISTWERHSFDNYLWGPGGLMPEGDRNIPAWKTIGKFMAETEPLPWLYLYSTPGLGKTHLALAIAWNYINQAKQAVFYQAEEMLDHFRAGFESGTYAADMHAAINCDLLVLDDIGGQKSTEWAVSKLDAILNSRYLEARATVFTSNYPPDYVDKERGHIIPERIADRVAEGLIARLFGESYRRRAK